VTVVASIIAVAVGMSTVAGAATPRGRSGVAAIDWVTVHDGHLGYGVDGQGNRIPDFSRVGYHAGDRALPDGPARVTLTALATGDDTARIQAALDQGGVVLLGPGAYRIGGTLRVARTGTVLRGSGSAAGGTSLVATGKPHTLVRIAGSGRRTLSGPARAVTDSYVPVGADTLHLDSVVGLNAGDQVVVGRPWEQNWIHDIGMDRIPPRPGGTPSSQWKPEKGNQFERVVTAVNGNAVVLDVPLPTALEKSYTHATVTRSAFPGRIGEAGLEHLSADGAAFATDPSFHDGGYFNSRLVAVDTAVDSWVRDVVAYRFGQAFGIDANAIRVSVVDTASPEVSVPQDISAQPVAYAISGQQSLVAGCRSTGSNYHAWATQARVAGPNVFTRCTATNTGTKLLDAGPHQRWALGTLYDAVTIGGSLELRDRQWLGSGQGWAGADSVLWNCAVDQFKVENPPTAYNWAIGCTGRQSAPSAGHQPGEIKPGPGVSSLYEAQLADRHR
jgi:hypothetical protein